MRPPWASTMPLQMDRPRPDPAKSLPVLSHSVRENFRNRCGSSSEGIPLPWSETDTATWTPSRTADTVIGDPVGEYRAALDSRLPRTWARRRRSAITGGKSGEKSTRMRLLRSHSSRNLFLASSRISTTSTGDKLTDNEPVSMRATSSSSPIKSCMWSTWLSMIRWNWVTTAGSRSEDSLSRVVVEPLMVANGVRSSWLTMPRNSARRRSCSSNGDMSCRVTTKETTSPSAEWMGVALISVVTLRPSGTRRTICSARTVSPALRTSAMGKSLRETSRPSARSKVTTSSNSSGD